MIKHMCTHPKPSVLKMLKGLTTRAAINTVDTDDQDEGLRVHSNIYTLMRATAIRVICNSVFDVHIPNYLSDRAQAG